MLGWNSFLDISLRQVFLFLFLFISSFLPLSLPYFLPSSLLSSFSPSFPSFLPSCLSLLLWSCSERRQQDVDNYLSSTGYVLLYSENLKGILKGDIVSVLIFKEFSWEKALLESPLLEKENWDWNVCAFIACLSSEGLLWLLHRCYNNLLSKMF